MKEQLYATARVKNSVFTENSEFDLDAGQFVAIRFMRRAWNGMRHREEPVYSVTVCGKIWGVMFASNLTDFCL